MDEFSKFPLQGSFLFINHQHPLILIITKLNTTCYIMNGYSEHDFSQLKRIKNALICDSLMNIDYTQNEWKYT